jgi:hypothetical protein
MVKEEFFLPWEARALDGLELPEWAEKNFAAVISISLSSVSGVEKTRRINWLSGRDATKRAVYGDEVGGKLRLDGRRNATNWAFDPGCGTEGASKRGCGYLGVSQICNVFRSESHGAMERGETSAEFKCDQGGG